MQTSFTKTSARARQLCAALFKALTLRESENRGIRRPQTLCRLAQIVDVPAAELAPLIEVFRQPGVTFLMPPPEVPLADATVIDISHESLMRVREQLRDWAEEEASSIGIVHRLAENAALHGKGKAGLYPPMAESREADVCDPNSRRRGQRNLPGPANPQKTPTAAARPTLGDRGRGEVLSLAPTPIHLNSYIRILALPGPTA